MIDHENLRGRRYGDLVVLRLARSTVDKAGSHWDARCQECGSVVQRTQAELEAGRACEHGVRTRRRQRISEKARKKRKERRRYAQRYRHAKIEVGEILRPVNRNPEYSVWAGMVSRCHNPNDPAYRYYGGRGIKVYMRWRVSFEAFLKSVGRRPEPRAGVWYSLDRIDNDGDYRPSNVRWATATVQARNKGSKRRGSREIRSGAKG